MAKKTSPKLKLLDDFRGVVQALLNTPRPPKAKKAGERKGTKQPKKGEARR